MPKMIGCRFSGEEEDLLLCNYVLHTVDSLGNTLTDRL